MIKHHTINVLYYCQWNLHSLIVSTVSVSFHWRCKIVNEMKSSIFEWMMNECFCSGHLKMHNNVDKSRCSCTVPAWMWSSLLYISHSLRNTYGVRKHATLIPTSGSFSCQFTGCGMKSFHATKFIAHCTS